MISDTEALANIGANVTALIGNRTYAEIAKACCTADWTCYPATIEKIANAQNMPGAGLLARLAEALGVTTDEIIFGPNHREKKPKHARRKIA